MNVCVEARTEIVTSIRNAFWNQINEKIRELYSSSSSTSHAMASACDAIASSISKIKASLVSYSFSVSSFYADM